MFKETHPYSFTDIYRGNWKAGQDSKQLHVKSPCHWKYHSMMVARQLHFANGASGDNMYTCRHIHMHTKMSLDPGKKKYIAFHGLPWKFATGIPSASSL